jgi:PII-like signaling protein
LAVLSTMLVSSSEARRLRTPTSVWMSTSSPRTCAAAQKDPMRLTGTALRLTVLVGESDRWHRRPLYTEIVHRAHQAGLAGATVLRGVEGFGATSLIHTARLLSLSDDLPVVIIIVDTHDRINAFLPQLEELVTEGLVMLDDCHVIRYVAAGGHTPGAVR